MQSMFLFFIAVAWQLREGGEEQCFYSIPQHSIWVPNYLAISIPTTTLYFFNRYDMKNYTGNTVWHDPSESSCPSVSSFTMWFQNRISSPLWTLSATHAFPLLVHLSGRFTNEWTFHIPKLDATSVTLFLGWHQFSSPCSISMKDFLLCLAVKFMVVCCYWSVPTPWHEITASESWVDVSEKSFKSSLLMNSKTICLFKTDSYFRFTWRTFWFEAKETLTQFFLFLRPYLKKKFQFSVRFTVVFL